MTSETTDAIFKAGYKQLLVNADELAWFRLTIEKLLFGELSGKSDKEILSEIERLKNAV